MCRPTHTGQEVLQDLAHLVKQTSVETGFGEVLVRTEQMNQKNIRVYLQAGTCYRYIVDKEDFERQLKSLIGDTAD